MAINYKRGYGTCHECDKELYRSRREAKRQAKKNHPDKVLDAYYCPFGNGYHYGNLPEGGRDVARKILRKKVEKYEQRGETRSTTPIGFTETGTSLVSGEEDRTAIPEHRISTSCEVVLSYPLERKEDPKIDSLHP